MRKIIQKDINFGIDKQCPTAGYHHDDGLWFDHEHHSSYAPMATYIYQTFISPGRMKTILDLGSGAGSLAYFIRKLDPSLTVVTIDGNHDTMRSPYIQPETHFIARTDQNYTLVYEDGERVIFDLVLSFEHFEHIETQCFDDFLKNIKKHINPNSICFCTASYLDRDVHPNLKSENEWHHYLLQQGFVVEDASILGDIPTPFNFNWGQSYKLLFHLL